MDKPGILPYLSSESIERIHQAGLDLLVSVGMKIEDASLRANLQALGCAQKNDRVLFPREVTERVLADMPKEVVLNSLDSKRTVVSPGSLFTHSSGSIPAFLDMESGRRRPALLKDVADAARVMEKLNELDLAGALVFPTDVPPAYDQVRQFETLLRYTRKPVYASVSSPRQAKYIAELFTLCKDGESPRGIVGVSPESPLFLPKDISDMMKTLLGAKLPLTILTAPVAGFSAPVTLAGVAAQVHAEIIGTTVVASLFNPKVPVVYGARACFVNMRTGNSIWGLPEIGIIGAVTAQLARRAGYVSDLYGMSSTSCAFDAQQGYERAINTMLPVLAGAELISGFGSHASLMTGSLAQLAIDNEMFAMVRKVMRGFEVNHETLAFDVQTECISDVSYIENEHTVKYVRGGEIFLPDMAFADMCEQWERSGMRSIEALAADRVKALLSEEAESVLSDEKAREMDRIVDYAKKDLAN